MKIKAIIFDMDGVLVDTEPIQFLRQQNYLQSLGITIPDEELKKIVGGNKPMTWQIISKYYHKPTNHQEYFEAFNTYYQDDPIPFETLLNNGVIQILDWLQKSGYRLALASSASPDKIEAILTTCQIKPYFELVISGDMFAMSKPHPEIYQTTAQQLGFEPAQCLAVEDSNYGIESAKRAGMYTVAKKETRFPFSQEHADEMIESLADLKDLLTQLNTGELDG
ncbi:haloacid dehalogenase superfamily, subfamily IA, variant 3 with third motif having DD or ED/haloacid dehalogenase superfamily, subfamily IA, variant 1 with third motif having Dx(3-4)D or Dx(3-4)E [Amphibacillus marinus]|uniref:Haloacid dehalogenase superfamily, subfamily IA, variant 3 with third motif having DD or ED/haloacid dehalogenase superfamily, subfamily IA, variant 1 with third motif having Dx(3-4)D or Dx(3-4)E n=1 Tax=Amphibacillus marinus TaxID=872970 RepID=A0A1H8T6N7_9BACI|nr:HAD family phosphatase [Amphibacillus marinus]SEO86617.1 haloacid dehalogenase superfamily, subfamily IA, variant 3 with third motif having DD or ED/haloacid dehalogenase superfamily, subfamily IA, variant 1 with third motif having Dx(3-4)D or Dx(3-4)E [Amphibacillus marinus]